MGTISFFMIHSMLLQPYDTFNTQYKIEKGGKYTYSHLHLDYNQGGPCKCHHRTHHLLDIDDDGVEI